MNPLERLWARLCCRQDDGEFLPGWDFDKREEGEWMEPIKKRSPRSDAPGGERDSGRDKAKESVSPKLTIEEWVDWLHVMDNLDELDIDALDIFPCPDEEIEAAVNKADFRIDLGVPGDAVKSPPWSNAIHEGFMTTSVGSLHSDDSVLMALKESNMVKEEIREDSSVVSDLSFDDDTAQKQAETKACSSPASNPQSGNGWEKESDRKIDFLERSSNVENVKEIDISLLVTRMKSADEVPHLVSRMESASEEARMDSANWDDSADWGDANLVAARPAEGNREARFTQKMSDVAVNRDKCWEGGKGIPSKNSTEDGDDASPRAAFDGNDSTSFLMDRMERPGDDLPAEEDGWEVDEDDGGAHPGEAGGRREGQRRTRRDTEALRLRMEALNAEFAEAMLLRMEAPSVESAAETDHSNDGDGDEKKDTTLSTVSGETTDLLNGTEDPGDVPRAPRKTTRRRASLMAGAHRFASRAVRKVQKKRKRRKSWLGFR